MTEDGRRRAHVIVSLVGAVLGVVGVIALVLVVAWQQPAPPEATSTTTASSDVPPRDGAHQPNRGGEPRPDGDVASLEMDYSEPLRVTIPKLGVSSSLEDLGLADDGTMETPDDPDKAGWFTPSVPPGVVGASVVAGHVTWNQQPAVFFRLGDLRPGDTINVERADGSTAVFTVDRLGEFPKNSFPTDAVYDQPDRPGLRLITCGGGYDDESNRYLANVIVWASLTKTSSASA